MAENGGSEVPVKVTRDIPDKTVVVTEGNEIHTGEGKKRVIAKGGDTVTLAGPEADDLVLRGHAEYVDE